VVLVLFGLLRRQLRIVQDVLDLLVLGLLVLQILLNLVVVDLDGVDFVEFLLVLVLEQRIELEQLGLLRAGLVFEVELVAAFLLEFTLEFAHDLPLLTAFTFPVLASHHFKRHVVDVLYFEQRLQVGDRLPEVLSRGPIVLTHVLYFFLEGGEHLFVLCVLKFYDFGLVLLVNVI